MIELKFISKILLTMYIDSPSLSKKKVLNSKNNINGGFGYERIQLANYVADELNNNHKDDAIILQKFRKQAEQYKRNLLRKKHSPMKSQSHPSFQPIQSLQNTKIKPLTLQPSKGQLEIIPTQITDEIDQRYNQREDRMKKNQIISEQITKIPNQSNKYLIRILEKKDKQLQKQAKVILKNEIKLNNLKKRIEKLQHEKKIKQADRISAIQQNNYDRMKGYIASISHKVLQNNSLLLRNLQEVQELKRSSLILNRKSSEYEPTILYSPQRIKNKKVQNPQKIYSWPKIQYNYKINSNNRIIEQKNQVNQILTNISHSRNRLDGLSPFF